MDAASKIRTILVALSCGLCPSWYVFGDESECPVAKKTEASAGLTACKCDSGVCPAGCVAESCSTTCDSQACETAANRTGIATFVSEWLSKTPRFSAEIAIHFGEKTNVQNKLGTGVPMLESLKLAPQIATPLRFSERISRIQFNELIGDVIVCGHRICSGNKCYDVKDEPVANSHCDTPTDPGLSPLGEEQYEPILVVPMAPPAPPGVNVASNKDENQTEASAILRNSGLSHVNISLPVTTIVDLLVAKNELSTRLELTTQIMDERSAAMDQLQSLAIRNAMLATQLAAAEAKQHVSDSLTASLVERADLALRLASVNSPMRFGVVTSDLGINGQFSLDDHEELPVANNVIKTIQEDLSNIRRQIALLRKSPVPFARSHVGRPSYAGTPSNTGYQSSRPYIPTAQLPPVAPGIETTCEGDDKEFATMPEFAPTLEFAPTPEFAPATVK